MTASGVAGSEFSNPTAESAWPWPYPVPCCHPSSSSQWQSIGQAKSNSRMHSDFCRCVVLYQKACGKFGLWRQFECFGQLKDCWSQIPSGGFKIDINLKTLFDIGHWLNRISWIWSGPGEMQEIRNGLKDPEKNHSWHEKCSQGHPFHILSDIFSYACCCASISHVSSVTFP